MEFARALVKKKNNGNSDKQYNVFHCTFDI